MPIDDPEFLLMFSDSFIKRFQGSVRVSNTEFIIFAETLVFSSYVPVPADWIIHENLKITPFFDKYASVSHFL